MSHSQGCLAEEMRTLRNLFCALPTNNHFKNFHSSSWMKHKDECPSHSRWCCALQGSQKQSQPHMRANVSENKQNDKIATTTKFSNSSPFHYKLKYMSWLYHYIPSSTTLVWLSLPSRHPGGSDEGGWWPPDREQGPQESLQRLSPGHLPWLLDPPYDPFLPQFLGTALSPDSLIPQCKQFFYVISPTNKIHRNNKKLYIPNHVCIQKNVDFGYFWYLISFLNIIILFCLQEMKSLSPTFNNYTFYLLHISLHVSLHWQGLA